MDNLWTTSGQPLDNLYKNIKWTTSGQLLDNFWTTSGQPLNNLWTTEFISFYA